MSSIFPPGVLSRNTPLDVPFTIVVDTREEIPYKFQSIQGDANQEYRPLVIPTERRGLKSGDYSIAGFEDIVTVERKSLADLYGTLGQGRKRFEAEHLRMASMEYAVVVIEAPTTVAFSSPPSYSRLPPKVVHRTWLDWEQDYGIPWHFCPSRKFAEVHTFRLLERFWKRKNKRTKGRAY